MRICLALLLVGCRLTHGLFTDRPDAAIDAADVQLDAPPPMFCPSDSHLQLCFSFDSNPLPATLPNEGAAMVSAQLTNVTRTTHGDSGAAAVGATSTIYVPYSAQVTGIQAIEIGFRVDAAPQVNNARFGLVDSNIIPPNISVFLYRVDPGYRIQCGLGAVTAAFSVPVMLGTWHYAACVCDADTLVLYFDGVKAGELATSGCASGGAFVADGLTIGSNNNGGPMGVNDWLIGAIDGLRLWDMSVAVNRTSI